MILIDPRFGSKKKGQRQSHNLGPYFTKLGVEYREQMLLCGDLSFYGNGPDGLIKIGVELKQVPDFVSSMQSGRIAEQIEKMSVEYGRSYVIIEGPYRASRRNGMLEVPRGNRYRPLFNGGQRRPTFWADVEKYITSLEEAGVRVRKTRTPWETVKTITQVLDGYWSKPYKDHRALNVLSAPQLFSFAKESQAETRVRRVAMSLDVGIGVDRSKAVAKYFGTVGNLADAPPQYWEEIPGLGKKIAKAAYLAVREDCRAEERT